MSPAPNKKILRSRKIQFDGLQIETYNNNYSIEIDANYHIDRPANPSPEK